MNSPDQPFSREALDQATSRRLARLAAMPVDTTNLDRVLRDRLPPMSQPLAYRWWSPLRIAAAIVLACGLAAGVIVFTRQSPAVASPTELVRLHEDAVAGRGHVVRVNSLEEANRTLALQWSARPDLPEVPGADVMACCLHDMGKARMAAVTMTVQGVPVTMAVADAKDMRSPRSASVMRNGSEWHVQSAGDVNMVSSRQSGRWICLMGRLSNDKLMELAESVKF